MRDTVLRSIVAIASIAMGASSPRAGADDLRVLGGGGAQAVLQALAPQFQGATGNHVELDFAVVGAIQNRLMNGEKVDIVVSPLGLLDAVDKAGAFHTRSRTIVGRIPIGVVVREGVNAPDISRPDTVRQALLDARSVVFPDPGATPTGKYLMGAFEQMGIATSMQPKIVFKNAIDGGVILVRDGKVDLGLFLVTEILPVKGAKLVGKLPPSLQGYVVYAAAVGTDSKASEAASEFVKFLSRPDARRSWEAAGFETVGTNPE